MSKEPVAIIGAIMAVVMALITFGVLEWSDAQVEAFQAVLIAVVPLVVIGVGSWVQRSKVYSPATVQRDFVRVINDEEPEADHARE